MRNGFGGDFANKKIDLSPLKLIAIAATGTSVI